MLFMDVPSFNIAGIHYDIFVDRSVGVANHFWNSSLLSAGTWTPYRNTHFDGRSHICISDFPTREFDSEREMIRLKFKSLEILNLELKNLKIVESGLLT